ncbi:MAG: photosynthetic complex assembly protein PuhC [Nevskiaceae bacterium]
MSTQRHDFPRPMLFAAAALIVGSLFVATVGALTRQEAPALRSDEIVAAYDIRFIDQPDGGLTAMLADGAVLAKMSSEESGFARGILRGLGRGRKLSGAAEQDPYRLVRTRDGRLLLEDDVSGVSIELGVFGSDNAESFARLWRAGDALKPARTG